MARRVITSFSQGTYRHHLWRWGWVMSVVLAVWLGWLTDTGTTVPTARAALANPAPYQTTSPHWPHIRVLDFGREARGISSLGLRNQALAWLAAHVDVIETSMDTANAQNSDTLSTYLHSLNPALKTFGYDYDLTMCQQRYCRQDDPTPHPIFSSLPEAYYLHVSEDTQLQFFDRAGALIDTITIPGCPAPQPITAGCRYQIFHWTQKRWIANVASAAWQQDTADRFITELQTNSAGQANIVDGLFLDEHGSGFAVQLGFGNQTIIVSGGGVREYGGQRPDPAAWENPTPLDTQYSDDIHSWLSYLQTRLAAAGKFAHINTAEYFAAPLALDNGLAMKGVMTEHLNRPDSYAIIKADRYLAVLEAVQGVVQAGGTVDLSGSWCAEGPAGYAPGNYSTGKDRYRMWSLASYYLAKEPVGSAGKVYFDPNLCINASAANPLDFMNEWLPAYEQNVGLPTGGVTVAAQGQLACNGSGYTVFSRQYEYARIFVRVKDGFACNAYDDTTAVSIPLGQTMQMLLPDGTRSVNLTSLVLRNGEAAILFPSVDTTVPGTTSDLRGL